MLADFDNEKNIMAHLEEETKQASIRKFGYSLWQSPRKKFAFLQTDCDQCLIQKSNSVLYLLMESYFPFSRRGKN